MARVTVEDCIEKVPNRFDLVLLASHRSRNIAAGSELTIDRDNDKTPVVALRELASETLELNDLRESLVVGLQRVIQDDDLPDEQEEKCPKLMFYGRFRATATMIAPLVSRLLKNLLKSRSL